MARQCALKAQNEDLLQGAKGKMELCLLSQRRHRIGSQEELRQGTDKERATPRGLSHAHKSMLTQPQSPNRTGDCRIPGASDAWVPLTLTPTCCSAISYNKSNSS